MTVKMAIPVMPVKLPVVNASTMIRNVQTAAMLVQPLSVRMVAGEQARVVVPIPVTVQFVVNAKTV